MKGGKEPFAAAKPNVNFAQEADFAKFGRRVLWKGITVTGDPGRIRTLGFIGQMTAGIPIIWRWQAERIRFGIWVQIEAGPFAPVASGRLRGGEITLC